MIGWLRGTVRYVRGGAIVVDVGGVGYEVQVVSIDQRTVGATLELIVHTIVRDDAIVLYGFVDLREREFFELLLATPGVGPSTALAALRTMSIDELARAIENGDAKRVALVPGIGAKTAGRIVLELKDKVAAVGTTPGALSRSVEGIEDALRALGYSDVEVRGALYEVELPADESAALRTALQLLRRQ